MNKPTLKDIPPSFPTDEIGVLLRAHPYDVGKPVTSLRHLISVMSPNLPPGWSVLDPTPERIEPVAEKPSALVFGSKQGRR